MRFAVLTGILRSVFLVTNGSGRAHASLRIAPLMTERVTAWQCIGCGRIEGTQPCIGICQDREADFVYASDHDGVLAQLAFSRRQVEALAALVRQLAHTTPRDGKWEQTYRALQARARQSLEALGNDDQPG